MDNKLDELIKAALKNTLSGGLGWQAFDSESFRTKIGTGFLHIQRGSTELSSDGESFYPYVTYSLQVSDSQGRTVAEYEVVEHREGFNTAHQLFEAARKSALKTDQVIDEMLHSLIGGSGT